MPFKKTPAHAPGLLTAPRIRSAEPGVYQVGILLTCVPGIYTNNPLTRAYQWKLDGVNIGGATGLTYLPDTPGVGECIETVTNPKGSLATSTLPVTIVAAPVAPTIIDDPVLTGSTVEGGTWTLSTGNWTGSPTGYAPQLFRDLTPVLDATNFTGVWSAADVGHDMTGHVTATNGAGSTSATSNTVVPTAAPAGIPIANAAALSAMFAAGVGASGGKTYLLAAVDFGAFSTSNHDFTSNPIIIVGQAGTKFASLVLTNIKGVSWSAFNIYGTSSAGVGLQVTGGSAHITFDAVTFNSLAAWGSQSGGGVQIRLSSFITVNGRRDASLSDITGRSNGVTLIDSANITLSNLTLSNIRIDGLRVDGCTDVLIDGNLGFSWFPQSGDHDDFIQCFNSPNTVSDRVTITNNGWVRQGGGTYFNGAAQGYFIENGNNFIISGNYVVGGLYNAISRSGGSETQIDDNFCQGYPDFAEKIIVRNGSVNAAVTNNSAQSITNYAGGGVNPGFTPTILPGSNTIISATAPGNYFGLDQWLLTHPLARAHP